MREYLQSTLEYKGFTFNLSSELFPFADSADELEKKFKDIFDSFRKDIIKGVIKGPLPSTEIAAVDINWEQYFKQQRTYRGEEKLNSYTKILVALGILSFKAENNWLVTSFELNVNPKLSDTYRLYFTDWNNAMEYAKASGWGVLAAARLTDFTRIK